MGNGESVLRCLCKNSNESQFCNRASCQFQSTLRGPGVHPASDALVEFVLEETQCDESVHVEEMLHGKSDRISWTCLLLKTGASGPALRTGSPVMGSIKMLTFRERVLRGVNTILPPSTFASSGSPVRRPSLRRIGLGRTTCPFVEILVSMVRQSYHNSLWQQPCVAPKRALVRSPTYNFAGENSQEKDGGPGWT